MRRFPRREAEVAALARQIITGMIEMPDDFPSPPLDPAKLQASLGAYVQAREDTVQARAAAVQACDAKDEALKELVEEMKVQLRYAEHAVRYDEAKLMAIGWRKRKEPSAMSLPGAARSLEVIREGLGTVQLKWKRPEDGGTVATYQVQVSHRSAGVWRTTSLCFETRIDLTGQERGVELMYRVVTLNKAGEGLASNIVNALL